MPVPSVAGVSRIFQCAPCHGLCQASEPASDALQNCAVKVAAPGACRRGCRAPASPHHPRRCSAPASSAAGCACSLPLRHRGTGRPAGSAAPSRRPTSSVVRQSACRARRAERGSTCRQKEARPRADENASLIDSGSTRQRTPRVWPPETGAFKHPIRDDL